MIDKAIQTYEGPALAPKPEILPEEALIALVQQAQGQDKDAFATLYDIYYPHVYGLLIGMVASPEVGQDLAQETFLKVWFKLPLLRETQRFSSWLYTIAKNISLDYLRRKRRELSWSNVEDAGTPKAIEDVEVSVERRELLRIVLAQIPPKAREILRLHLENYSHAEIATMLGIGQESVATYISAGRKQAREAYSQLLHEGESAQTAASPRRRKSPNYSRQPSYSEVTSQLTRPVIAFEVDAIGDKSEKEMLDSIVEQQDAESEPHEQSFLKEEHTEVPPELIARINRLPETYRETLYLSLVERLSNQQIATQLGLPLGTVKSHISRGGKLLRRILTEQGKESEHFAKERGCAESPAELIARINRLPETYRETLYLSLVEHLSNQQIATQLGLPLGTVKSHISRGKKLLFGMKQSQTEGDRVADLQREPRQRSADKAVLPFANPFPVPKEMKQALLELEGMSARHEYLIQLPDPIESQVAPPPAPPTMSHEEMPPLRYSEDYDEHIVNTTDAGEFETVKTYLREIAHIPMITHEREIELAQRIEAGDCEARDRFILANLRLVVSIARRYIGHGLPLPDLIQEGNIGLIRAIERYDWRRGHRFSTHAIWWIRQAISYAVANKGRTIRLPIHVDFALRRLRRERQRLLQELGREPTGPELAEAVGPDLVGMVGLQAALGAPVSLALSVSEDEGQELGDVLVDKESISPEESAIRHALRNEVQSILESMLTPRERLILQLRFGLDNGQTHPLTQVGRELGITRERVRQIEAGALAKLRQPSVLERLRG